MKILIMIEPIFLTIFNDSTFFRIYFHTSFLLFKQKLQITNIEAIFLQNMDLIQRIRYTSFKTIQLYNQQYSHSITFLVLIQTCRLLLGHSRIYRVFVEQNFKQITTNNLGNFLSAGWLPFQENTSNNQIVHAFIISFTIILIAYIFLYFSSKQFTQKYLPANLTYYITKILETLTEIIFAIFAIAIYTAFNSSNYLILILTIISLTLSLLFFKVITIFYHQNSFENKDLYTHNFNLSVKIQDIIFSILTFIGALAVKIQFNRILSICILLFWLTLQIQRFWNTVFKQYYQKNLTNYVYKFAICYQTTEIVIFTLATFVNSQTFQSNIFIGTIVGTIFLYWALINYTIQSQLKCLQWKIQEITSSEDFYHFMSSHYRLLVQVQQQASDQTYLMLSSIKRNHQSQCTNVKCFCHKQVPNREFFKIYLLKIVEQLQQTFKNKIEIFLYIQSFKFNVYNDYLSTYPQISSIKNQKKTGIIQRFRIFSLKNIIQDKIIHQNRISNSLRIESTFELQQQIQNLNNLIQKALNVKFQKWTLLKRQVCNSAQIKLLAEQQLKDLIEIITKNSQKFSIFQRSKKFNILLYFYLRKVSFQFNEAKKIQQNLKQLNKQLRNDEISKIKCFKKNLFEQICCTLQTSTENKQYGTIINVTKSVFDIFGWKVSEIIGRKISILKPEMFKSSGNQNSNYQLETQNSLQKQKGIFEVFCIDRNSYVFPAQKYERLVVRENGISLISSIQAKKQVDYLLINQKGMLYYWSKGFKHILKNLQRPTNASFVFQSIKQKISDAKYDQEKEGTTIIYDQKQRKQMLNNYKSGSKKLISQKSMKSMKSIKQILPKVSQVIIDQQKSYWKTDFHYKKVQQRGEYFYALKIKIIQFMSTTDNQFRCESNFKISQIQTMTQCSLGQASEEGNLDFLHENNSSSMGSYNKSQAGYEISKLINVFEQSFKRPQTIKNKRNTIKLIISTLQVCILISLTLTCLLISEKTLNDKVVILQSRLKIDHVFHLLEVSANHLMNIEMYKYDSNLQKLTLNQLQKDANAFQQSFIQTFKAKPEQLSPLKKQPLYKYLDSDMTWIFSQTVTGNIKLQSFFEFMYYSFHQVIIETKNKFEGRTSNLTLIKEIYSGIEPNLQFIRRIRLTLNTMTEQQLDKDSNVNKIIFVSLTMGFFVFSLLFALFTNYDRKFRFFQNINAIKMYQMLSKQYLNQIYDYYLYFFKKINQKNKKISDILENNLQKLIQKQAKFQQSTQSADGNKIKLVGSQKYVMWAPILIVFVILNVGNFFLSYRMYLYNVQIGYYSRLINNISYSQSVLLNRYMRTKAKYYFNKPTVNMPFIDEMLSRIQITEVQFDFYVTEEDNWIMKNDQQFRKNFNQIIQTNPCVLNKEMFTTEQIVVCQKYAVLSQNGIITFVNGMSRQVRNMLLDWKRNLSLNLQLSDYFAAKTQFKQIDFVVRYHIDTFRKMGKQIIELYSNGFQDQFNQGIQIFTLTVIINLLVFIWNLNNFKKDKQGLSYLYGSLLLIPQSCLRQSQYLIKFVQNNIQYKHKY